MSKIEQNSNIAKSSVGLPPQSKFYSMESDTEGGQMIPQTPFVRCFAMSKRSY